MAKEYISREVAIALADGGCHPANLAKEIAKLPAADVAPVAEINDAVDEALRILDAINSSGRITYNTYCELHNAICEIYQDCGADMREADNED